MTAISGESEYCKRFEDIESEELYHFQPKEQPLLAEERGVSPRKRFVVTSEGGCQ